MSALLTLPLVLAVVFVELAVGGVAMMWLLDRRGEAPAGFLRLTGAVNLACAVLALLLVPVLPINDAAVVGLNPDALAAFARLTLFVTVLTAVHLLATFTPSRGLRELAGILAIIVGLLALGAAAVARPVSSPEAAYDVFALVALPVAALALGGSNAAMLLGHWYLVTPKLSTEPLRRAALTVVVAVALQVALVCVAIVRGDLQTTLEGALTVAAALRLGVGLLMTGGVALAAWWTARLNTQSSTGLLYVGIGTVLAGEISARVVFFLTGVSI